MIAAVGSAQGVNVNAMGVPVARGGTASLLPAPDLSGLGEVQDALSILYEMRVEQGKAETKSVETAMKREKEETKVQLQRELAAMEAARKAEQEANGFWGKLKALAGSVAKIASVVAGAAAVVATGGTGLALVVAVAAVALSAGGTIVRETKLLGKDSDKIGMGMEIAGAVVGLGTSVASAVSAGTAAASSGSHVASSIGNGAQVTGAAATGTSAVAGIKTAHLRADADHARADAEDARGQMAARQREIRFLAQTLAETKEAEREALDTTIKAIEGCNQAADIAIAGVRG